MSKKFTDPASLSAKTLEQGDIFAPKFDEKGLVTAIAIDAKSNEILMLAYMNEQAISLTLKTGKVHYFSRSRNKIWLKGETSGEIQSLVEMRVDCDQDAILIMVEQQGLGAACHTGRKSCFFRKVENIEGNLSLKTIGDEPLFDPKKIY